jgi:hypothetical protein
MVRAVLFIAFCTWTPSFAADEDGGSLLTKISALVKGSLSRELDKLIGAGSLESGNTSPTPSRLYTDLLDLKAIRKDYTTALQSYLDAKKADANFFDLEEDRVRVVRAAKALSNHVHDLTQEVISLGLQLDRDDESIRRALDQYTDGKNHDLETMLSGPRLFGMSLTELEQAAQRAKQTGDLLDSSLKVLLADLKQHYPNVTYLGL